MSPSNVPSTRTPPLPLMEPFQEIPEPRTEVTRVAGLPGPVIGWISSRFLNIFSPKNNSQSCKRQPH
jgi:hypothetical protein